MPLTKQLIPLSFASGVDTKTDEKQTIPGKLLELQNGEFTNTGAINKRPGSSLLSTALVTGGNIAGAEAIASFRQEQLVFDGYNMYSYLPSTSQWIARGTAVSAVVDDLTVIRQTTTQQLSPDMATANGVSLFAWEDSRGGLRYSARDTTTQAYFVTDSSLDTDGYKPKCLAFDGYLCAIYYTNTGTALHLATINTTTPTSLSKVSLVTDVMDGYRAYDACVADGYIFVSYINTANQIATFSINGAFAVSASYKLTAAVGSTSQVPVSITADSSNQLWLAWWDNVRVRAAIINSALSATVLVPTTVDTPPNNPNTIGVVQDPTLVSTARIFYDPLNTYYWQTIITQNTLTSAGVVGTAASQVRSVGIAGKPFAYDGYIYLPTWLDTAPSGLQDTYFLLQTATNTVVSKVNAGLGGGHVTNHLLPETQNIAPGQYTFANLVKGAVEAEGGALFSLLGVNATTITFNPTNSFMSAVQGNNLLINGGVLTGYDGNTLTEFGFNYYPENLNSQDLGPPTDGYNQVVVTTTTVGTASAANVSKVLLLQANMLVPGCYVTWQTAGGLNYCFWFKIAGIGVAPVFLAATTVIQVTLLGTETASGVATKVDAALSGTGYTHSVSGATETITNSVNGVVAATQFVVGPNGVDSTGLPGNFQYLATYEWSDVFGQIQRSATSPPFSMTTDGYATSINIDVPTYRLSSKTGVRIVIYRTQNNGTLFYRVTSAVVPFANNPLVDDVSFIDTLPDSALINNELVYITGSVLDNFAPPSNKFITTYRNRVWLGGIADNPYTLWFSKVLNDLTSNTSVPIEFSDGLTFSVEDLRAGKITALSVLDSGLVIFMERGIYSLTGDGPDATGANSDYGDPTMIAAGDVGCTYPNGLSVTPNGIMFKSTQGGDIYLLDRTGQIQYSGTPVTAFANLDVTSATLNPIADQVIFTTATGVQLVYDYFSSQWATWTMGDSGGVIDSDVWNGNYVYATPNGRLYQQTPNAFLDQGSEPISMKVTTGWLSFAGLQGYKRVFQLRILGSFKSNHTLTVKIAYDMIDTYTQTVVIDTSTLSNPTDYAFKIGLDQTRCSSIKVSIQDAPEAPYGEGFSISSLAFLVGVKKGPRRLPAGQQFGS